MTTKNECRVAFEQWMRDWHLFSFDPSTGDDGNYLHDRTQDRFDGWKAAWNHRPAATADDQQAKDAARYRGIYDGLTGIAVCKWSEQDNRWLPCVNRAAADYTIDAAISTTKQEEV